MACPTHTNIEACAGHVNTCLNHWGYVGPRPIEFTNATVSTGDVIDLDDELNELKSALNVEASRNFFPDGAQLPDLDNPVDVVEIRGMRDLYIQITSAPLVYPLTDTELALGAPIIPITIEDMKNGLVSYATTCSCQCNYLCTCQCNYTCTCYCDYVEPPPVVIPPPCTCDTFVAPVPVLCPCNCNHACICDCDHNCKCDCNYACKCDCNHACICDCDYVCPCDVDLGCPCDCDYCTCDCNYCTCDCDYCTCDCNYCTCDCNYCTCDCAHNCICDCDYVCKCACNYACRCNCNYTVSYSGYSDKRLKTDVRYI